MSDDELLRALGQMARQERDRETARLDERWDRLAAGDLSAAEEAELRSLAAASEEARQAYEAFRPLGADFQARVVQAIRDEAGAAAATAAPPVRVLPFRPRAGWLAGALGAAAAVAASLVFLVRAPAPLPGYVLAVAGGDQPLRGAPAAAPEARVLHPGSSLTVLARPSTEVPDSDRLEARWFVARGAEIRELVAPRKEVAPGGAVRLSGTLGEDLAIELGEWSLWVVVGRQGRLPGASLLRAHRGALTLRGAGWIALRDPVTLRIVADR
ncbi:MAG TPA: hypothetical protein VHR45_08375 [Thermoanaerobaculia bacterium]|nr:hypothetical protein [Thermoanaerobaculia bacterium]